MSIAMHLSIILSNAHLATEALKNRGLHSDGFMLLVNTVEPLPLSYLLSRIWKKRLDSLSFKGSQCPTSSMMRQETFDRFSSRELALSFSIAFLSFF